MIVSIPKTKTGRRRMFSIVDDEGGMDYLGTIRNTGTEDQKTSLTITSLLVAEKMLQTNLETWGKKLQLFETTKPFRRSSAILLADSSADLSLLIRTGRALVQLRVYRGFFEYKNKIAQMSQGTNTAEISLRNTACFNECCS